jgi:cytochrome P450
LTHAITKAAPACDVDFFCDAYLTDPVSGYHRMLATGPVVWLPQNELHAICGYDALTASLRNHRVFQSGKGVSINEKVNEFLIGSTLNSDPPEHDAQRAITFGTLTPRALQDVRAKVEKEANFIAAKVVALGEFDAVADLATYLPLTIVRDLVGLGVLGKENMLKWAGATFEMMGDPRDRRDAATENMGELRQFLENPEMLNELSPDGWAIRATRMAIEAGIEPTRAVSLMRDYIAPSLDTTISAIGYGIMLFGENPVQWEMLRNDRSLMRNAIEEIVRLNTPIKTLSRLVAEDVEVGGAFLPKGIRALMLFGAANRDPSKFDNPDAFDIKRNTRGHVGFGHGVHACLGMHLARLEMSSLFNALADRIERFEIIGAPVKAKNSTIHSLESMMVRVRG